MDVQIDYVLRGDATPYSIQLSPSQYYDDQDSDEPDDDKTERFNHASEYLAQYGGIDPEMLESTELVRTDRAGRFRVFTRYFPRSRVTAVTHTDGTDELIVDSTLSADKCHVVRVERSGSGDYRLLYNGVISRHEDGSESEERFDS